MELDKRYDYKKVEEHKYETWKKKGYFTAGDKSKEKFSMVIPPPNITGKLHIGHSIDTTIQDITCRYKKAKGFDVLYLPGMDHAGIATQAKIDQLLKSEGKSRFEIGRKAFLEEAFKWKEKYGNIIHDQWAKMGLMLDYSRERFTMDDGFNKAVFKVFKDLYDQGLIYHGEKIVNYDPVMRTALSNIEVIYKEISGKFYYFKYRLVDNKEKYLTVATTRPETMFGDTCVVVNPNDDRYKSYVGKKVINPANGEELPIIADDYVDISFGTGAMKCTPAHDPNDFIIGQKYNQPHPVVINIDGTMSKDLKKYGGMDRFECREVLVNDIKEHDDLIKIEDIKHEVGHSERSDAIVEPILSKQWFVKMKPIAEKVLAHQKTSDKVNFIPKRFEKVLTRWMENCEDWCISRQLWWGHQIPVYYSKSTGKLLVSDHMPDNSGDWVQDEDVFDTWFSSALWPFATLGWPEKTEDLERYYPLDTLVTGYDIIFFWVSRMYFQGLNFTDRSPFKNVVIHGLVRDSKNRKMSKSLGNGVDPIDVIEKYGVDSLRYFLATAASPGQDIRYQEERIQVASNYLNKIWNSARYILMYIPEDFKISKIDIKKLNLLDKYILSKLEATIKKVTKAMDKYDYGIASSTLYNFVYDDFCSFYLEMTKVTLQDESANKDVTLNVLLYVLKAIIMMIYPFSPFISEEIYLHLPGHLDSIMLDSYPKYSKKYAFNDTEEINTLRIIIEKVRNYKAENNLAPNASLTLTISSELDLNALLPYLKRFTFTNNISFSHEIKKGATSIVSSNFTLYIEDNINKEEALEKLNKQKEALEKEIKRSEGMLNNKNFLERANKAKVEEEKNKYENYKKQLNEVINKINNL